MPLAPDLNVVWARPHILPRVAMILGSSAILRKSLLGLGALSTQTLGYSLCDASMAW